MNLLKSAECRCSPTKIVCAPPTDNAYKNCRVMESAPPFGTVNVIKPPEGWVGIQVAKKAASKAAKKPAPMAGAASPRAFPMVLPPPLLPAASLASQISSWPPPLLPRLAGRREHPKYSYHSYPFVEKEHAAALIQYDPYFNKTIPQVYNKISKVQNRIAGWMGTRINSPSHIFINLLYAPSFGKMTNTPDQSEIVFCFDDKSHYKCIIIKFKEFLNAKRYPKGEAFFVFKNGQSEDDLHKIAMAMLLVPMGGPAPKEEMFRSLDYRVIGVRSNGTVQGGLREHSPKRFKLASAQWMVGWATDAVKVGGKLMHVRSNKPDTGPSGSYKYSIEFNPPDPFTGQMFPKSENFNQFKRLIFSLFIILLVFLILNKMKIFVNKK